MQESLSKENIARMAEKWIPASMGIGEIHYDTTNFFKVGYGDVVVVGEKAFFVRNNAKEGRFGLDDEEKFWVKRCIDIEDGSLKIVKLKFLEKFKATIANFTFDCFRSPKKEARLLDLVAGHDNFMQGYWVKDEAGNIVRIIDYIYGKSLHSYIQSLCMPHETYYREVFPEVFKNYLECVKAVDFLHQHREKHGDVRRDHILIDRETNRYRWIDFDFNYLHRENIYSYDLFGLGNILMFIAGGGDVLLADLKKSNPQALDSLDDRDLNIVFHNRVANLKKIYPYIPEPLNRVLLHFSKGAELFYENTSQLLNDLGEIHELLQPANVNNPRISEVGRR
jgi:hypothetical protein